MAPFPLTTPVPQPRFNKRQGAGEIVLSITQAYTTYTTTIDLAPSTTVGSVSTPTTAASTQEIRSTSPSSPGTGVIIGAVLGSILGTLVLITLFYKCCIDNRSAVWVVPPYTSYDSDSDSTGDGDVVGTRGGGFSHRNRHGDPVRRPGRARTRRHSRRRWSESPNEMGYSSRHHRRRSSITQHHGLFGWVVGAPRSSRRHSGWHSTRRDGFSADD